MVPMGRIELPTSPLPRECSTTEPHGHLLMRRRAFYMPEAEMTNFLQKKNAPQQKINSNPHSDQSTKIDCLALVQEIKIDLSRWRSNICL
jgi:hypothetical protein